MFTLHSLFMNKPSLLYSFIVFWVRFGSSKRSLFSEFIFTTACVKCCVAAIKCPLTSLSSSDKFENRISLNNRRRGVNDAARHITAHKQTQ